MLSTIQKLSTRFTENIFYRLDVDELGYLDERSLVRGLTDFSREEVKVLLQSLDQDGDMKVSPEDLKIAIANWLSQPPVKGNSSSFAQLVSFYGPD